MLRDFPQNSGVIERMDCDVTVLGFLGRCKGATSWDLSPGQKGGCTGNNVASHFVAARSWC